MASMQEYLKRYTEGGATDHEDKKKEKKKKKLKEGAVPAKKLAPGIVIHDEDVQWQKEIEEPVEEEEEVDDAPVEEADADTRMKLRLDMLREKQAKSGSGWTEVGTGASSPTRSRHNNDIAPNNNGTADASPPRRPRHDSPGLYPPRKSARHDSPDLSPPRKARHDSPDLPKSRRVRHDSPGLSPPRKGRHDSPDLSPPKRARAALPDLAEPPKRVRHDSPDLSPPRKNRRAEQDLSPPRKHRQASPDLSPPRKARRDSPDLSPPRRGRDFAPPKQRPAADSSPPRKRRNDSPDLSPPRPRKPRHDSPEKSPPRNDDPRPKRMTDGTLAGLRTGKDLQVEIDAKRAADAKRFAALDVAVTGQGAGTVYRDKTGKRVTEAELKAAAEAAAKKRKEDELPPPEWGKGMAQQRAVQEKAKELEDMRKKPFARTRDDKDLDNMLKSRSRWGDPMAHLVKNKGPSEADLVGQLDTEELRAQGFIVPQDIPPHSWLKRGLAPPYNRFGIRPGRHWDGVDRSTGFEKEIVKANNAKQARANEAYLWSVADM